MSRVTAAATLGLAVLLAFPQASTGQTYDPFDQMYGTPEDVSLADLVSGVVPMTGRAVRTRGRVDFPTSSYDSRNPQFVLRDSVYTVLLVPTPHIAQEFYFDARTLVGREIRVVGLYHSSTDALIGAGPSGTLEFWKFEVAPERQDDRLKDAKTLTLESLVAKPGKYDGKLVRVVGQFRGRNLFGDLPISSQKTPADWIIKDDLYAVWVKGKKPKGSGWELDVGLKRDTGKWIEVVGRPETRNGITYVVASHVLLTHKPVASVDAKAPPPLPEKPKVPPVVVFSLPLDGETEVPTNSRFVVQFSKDMDEKSFKGRVRLHYVGQVQAGDRPFDAARMTYDGGRRALTLDPGDLLRPGRKVELILMPGIVDLDAMDLVPRPEKTPPEGVTDVLLYEIGSPGFAEAR